MNFVYMLRFLTNVTELENVAHVYQIPSEAEDSSATHGTAWPQSYV